jgi:hypothetical protein
MSKVFCDVCFKQEIGHENDLSVMRRRLAEKHLWSYTDDTEGACDAIDRLLDPARRGTS